jgi:hypothetical protein
LVIYYYLYMGLLIASLVLWILVAIRGNDDDADSQD